MDLLLLSQWISTGFMTGLIWFVQVVHYPIYANVSPQDLPKYQQFHVRRTTLVVFPMMVTELIGGALLLVREWQGELQNFAIWGIVLLGVIWLSTLLLQIPRHDLIGKAGSEDPPIRSMVLTNWIRTLAWSGRLALLAVYVPPGLKFAE